MSINSRDLIATTSSSLHSRELDGFPLDRFPDHLIDHIVGTVSSNEKIDDFSKRKIYANLKSTSRRFHAIVSKNQDRSLRQINEYEAKSVDTFLGAVPKLKSPEYYFRGRFNKLGWGMTFLCMMAIVVPPPLLPFCFLFIVKYSHAWDDQWQALSKIKIDTEFGTKDCTIFAKTRYGVCADSDAYGDGMASIATACQNPCDILGSIGGRWGGCLTGIIGSLFLIGFLIYLQKSKKTFTQGVERFDTVPVEKLPGSVGVPAKRLLDQCSDFLQFPSRNYKIPFKDLLFSARRLKTIINGEQQNAIPAPLPAPKVEHKSVQNESAQEPLLREHRIMMGK